MNRVIPEDLEQKVMALRAMDAKLRNLEAGDSFGDLVAGGDRRELTCLSTR